MHTHPSFLSTILWIVCTCFLFILWSPSLNCSPKASGLFTFLGHSKPKSQICSIWLGFPGGTRSKEPTWQWRRRRFNPPGSGRSPGWGHGTPIRPSDMAVPADTPQSYWTTTCQVSSAWRHDNQLRKLKRGYVIGTRTMKPGSLIY